jgi:hypothetical protein
MSTDQRLKKKRINHITILFPSLPRLRYWTFKYSKFLAPVIEKSIKTSGTPDFTSTCCIRLVCNLTVLFHMPLLLTWGTSFCYTWSHSFQIFLINKRLVIIGEDKFKNYITFGGWEGIGVLHIALLISYYLCYCQYTLNGFNWQHWIFFNQRLWR